MFAHRSSFAHVRRSSSVLTLPEQSIRLCAVRCCSVHLLLTIYTIQAPTRRYLCIVYTFVYSTFVIILQRSFLKVVTNEY